MKFQKPSSILIFSILLIIVAVGLLGTSVYFLLENRSHSASATVQKKDSLVKKPVIVADSVAIPKEEPQAAEPISSDSINAKLNEIYEMKKGLPTTVTNSTDTSETAVSRRKISELLEKVEQLQSKTTKVESENKLLKSLLAQLSDELHTRQRTLAVATPTKSYSSPATINRSSAKPAISDFRVSFLTASDKETFDAASTDRVSGSFLFRNATSEPVYVVIIRPDGKVLQTSEWDGGIFETADGRKMYSYKLMAESSDVARRINFSVPTDNFQRGSYTIQLYTSSGAIAKTSRTLY